MTLPPIVEQHLGHQLGAYVLGGLSPDEDAAVIRHLIDCDTCAHWF